MRRKFFPNFSTGFTQTRTTMLEKATIIWIAFLLHFSQIHGQCLPGDSLLKKIAALRESKVSASEQIKVLSNYERGIDKCNYNHDSVHATLLRRLGSLYSTLGDFLTSINYYQRNIDLINKNATKPSVNLKQLILSYYWISAFNDSLHRVTEKMKALDSCAAVAIRLKSIDAYCLWALYNRAVYCFDIGDYHRCINYADLCEALASDFAAKGSKQDFNDGTQYAIKSMLWHTNALILLGEYDEAKKLLEKKEKECKKPGLEQSLSVIYGSLAEVLELKGDYEKVLFYHDKAFSIEKRFGEAINCKAMLNDLGYRLWFLHHKNFDKALDCYKRALSYKVPDNGYGILNSLESLSILNRIANIFVLRKNFDTAFRCIQRAFDQIKMGTNETEVLHAPLDEFVRQRRIGYIATLITDKAIAFHERYKTSHNLQDISEAIRIYKVADQFLERIKTEQSDVQSKLFWRSDRHRLYELAIEACRLCGRMDDAFYFFERSRAVLLYDELQELRLMSQEDIIRQAELRKKISQLQATENNTASEQSRRVQADLLLFRQELDKLNKLIAQQHPTFYNQLSETNQVRIDEIRHRLLKEGDALVEFFDGDSAVYSMIIERDKSFLHRINKDSFDRTVMTFMSYLSHERLLNERLGDFITTSRQLCDLIFQQYGIPTGRLIVSHDRHYFPVEALVTNKSSQPIYLLQNHPVSYTHSARLLLANFNLPSGVTEKNFLGLAPVNFRSHPNVPALIGSDISLKTLRSNFDRTNCLSYEAASKANFMAEFYAYKVIQLYTHASDGGNEREPEIYFADSILTLSQLVGGKKPIAGLIVLSACETGSGKWRRGEGVFSFNRGFMALGIPSTVSNLWSVDNVSTYRLTELFYKYIAKGLPIDVSLQQAKLEFLKKMPKEKTLPFYWAATIAVGKTEGIRFNKTFPWRKLGILTILGCSLIYFSYAMVRRRKIKKVG